MIDVLVHSTPCEIEYKWEKDITCMIFMHLINVKHLDLDYVNKSTSLFYII